MQRPRASLACLGLAAGLLAACAPGQRTAFDAEAGAIADAHGNFGAATMHNTQCMTGEKDCTTALAERFADAVETTVNFDFDSARLGPEARATLARQADFIRQFPELRFRVYGHTDLVGTEAYNQRLGLRRARAVVDFFVRQGISRDRLEAVVSFGERQPLIVTEGRERRNRRTVTEVNGFYERHPTVLDGRYAEVIYREYVASAQPQSDFEAGAGGGGAGGGQ
ncbi:OmpA family protein [Rhodosalinus sediminis]|uniref:OmpA family protein n=1 Tax=Rhodosalinus sediminis TaxID=1940533 RepID=A0A3D9C014_9RHOB|nr:OmpA family protein [Rhodosalinus sediminis]REC58952.1 OmpA family protein [Rhodosalinus sediminis]